MTKEEFEKLYFSMSVDDLAERLGICTVTVIKIAKKHGLTKWFKPSRKEFEELYFTMTDVNLAKHFKVSISAIARAARKFGIIKRVAHVVLDEEEFKKLYFTMRDVDLATHYKVSVSTIAKIARKCGISKRNFAPDKKEFENLYRSMFIKDLAKYYHVGTSTIIKIVKKYNLTKRKIKPNKEELQRYLNLHTNKQTAEYFNLSFGTISKLINKYDLTDMDKELKIVPSNKFPIPNRDLFENIYLSKSLGDAAAYFGVSESVIDAWRHHFGIKSKLDKNLPNFFTNEQHELLIGSLLGDGYLSKVIHINSHYAEGHCVEQLDYLKYKYDILKPFSGLFGVNHGYRIIYIDKNNYYSDYNQPVESHFFNTYTSPLFTDLERKWYKRDENGNYVFKKVRSKLVRIKQLPKDLKLSPFIIAIWYFDDGYNDWNAPTRRSRNLTISTQSFTHDECEFLVEMLKKFGITHCHVNKENRINILSKSFIDFIDMVKPYVVDCMKYKVNK